MMLPTIIFMSLLTFFLSVFLAISSILFQVEENPRLEAIKACLPGLNCGG